MKINIGVLTDSAAGNHIRQENQCWFLLPRIHSHGCPVSAYSTGVWGFKEIANCDTILHKAICTLVKIHEFKLESQYPVERLLYHTHRCCLCLNLDQTS